MKQHLNSVLSISIIACAAWLFLYENSFAGDIRKPVWSGRFYPASQSELEKNIDRLTHNAKFTKVNIPYHKKLKALIMPHAGYIYSGYTAAHASLVLHENQFDKVILIGPDHKIGFKNASISEATAYQTPLGLVKLHEDTARLRKHSELFQTIPASDRREHSLEVILPFLQRYLKEFTLIPIVMGPCDIEQAVSKISPLIDDNTLLVASSDLSHYLPYEEATAKDKETNQMIVNLESDKLFKCENCACGKIPILILLNMAHQYKWQPIVLHYSNSGDTAGSRSNVVGYTTIAFYGGSIMQKKKHSSQKFNKKQGNALLKLARHTIMKRFGRQINKAESKSLSEDLKDNDFKAHRGVFVTLKKNHQLRGCIGSLTATESIIDGIKDNAINAAFHDPRFPSLTDSELDQVDIEVSILTEPQPLEYIDHADLISKLRVNVDGVIIRKGLARATFLPQVWEQLPKPEEFLSHLCAKAGLPSNSWENNNLEVKTYQVQYFEESK